MIIAYHKNMVVDDDENGNRKITLFKLFLFLSIAIILPSLFVLLNAFEDRQDIRSRASQGVTSQPQKIIFLEFEFKDDEQGDKILKFDKPEIRNGYVNTEIPTSKTLFTATVLNDNLLPITSLRFSLPELVAIDGLDASTGREHGEMKEVEADEFALSLPYHDAASFVKIQNIQGDVIALLSLQNADSINNIIAPSPKHGDEYDDEKDDNHNSFFNTLYLSKVFASNGTFNIAIIGDNYQRDSIRFQSDVNDLAKGLISIEPFTSNKDKVVFYPQLSSVAICQEVRGWPSINCNDSLALQEASTIPYDKVYVVYNGNYTGYAYIGGVLSYGSNSLDQNLAVKQGLFIHEMAGHSLGGLMDEYSYGTSGLSYAPNCSISPSCPSWISIPGLSCFNTCGYTNLYRATDNSVMNTSYFRGLLTFDGFSTQIVLGKLSEYLKNLTSTATIPPVSPAASPTVTSILSLSTTPTFTPTATPSPSTTPSPTISPTFGPSITLAPGVTVIPTLTPTATPTLTIEPSRTFTLTPSPAVIVCSLPNFCMAEKYCSDDLKTEGSCGISGRICCRPQTEFKNESDIILNPQGNLPTPTSVQRFADLPTVPPPSPTPQILTTPTPIVSPTEVYVTATTVPSATRIPTRSVTSTPSFEANNLSPQNIQATRVMPTGVHISEVSPTEEILALPTPTSELEFERTIPTPTPTSSVGNIFQTSVSFIATLFKTVLALLLGQ